MVTKKAHDLTAGDTIGVSAEMLQKPGQGFFRVSVIRVDRDSGNRCRIYTAGGCICCGGDYQFEIVDSGLHTDDLMPQFTKKPTHKGRSVD